MRAQAADRLKTQILGQPEPRTADAAERDRGAFRIAGGRPPAGATRHSRPPAIRRRTPADDHREPARPVAAASDRTVAAGARWTSPILRQAVDAARTHSAAENTSAGQHTGADTAAGDRRCLGVRRIADNLISNAVKFTAPGGHVRVGVEAVEGSVAIVVEDTGRAFPRRRCVTLGSRSWPPERHQPAGPGSGQRFGAVPQAGGCDGRDARVQQRARPGHACADDPSHGLTLPVRISLRPHSRTMREDRPRHESRWGSPAGPARQDPRELAPAGLSRFPSAAGRAGPPHRSVSKRSIFSLAI